MHILDSETFCLLIGYMYGPMEFSRQDVVAVNIQRGRDHGIQDYNSVRKQFKLDAVRNLGEINPALKNDDEVNELNTF